MGMSWSKMQRCCKCAANSVSEPWIWDRSLHVSSSISKIPGAADQSNPGCATRGVGALLLQQLLTLLAALVYGEGARRSNGEFQDPGRRYICRVASGIRGDAAV